MEKSADAFRTISEVAEDLDTPQHVLRFWETRFGQIRPMKRGGGRRYYRPDDVDLLRGIKHLLYGEGYTIKGVQRILKEEGVRFVQAVGREGTVTPQSVSSAPLPAPEPDDLGDEPEAAIVPPPVPAREAEIRPSVGASRISIEPDAGGIPARGRPKSVQLPLFEGLPGSLSPAGREALRLALSDLEQCRRLLAGADTAADEADQGFEGAA